jgi:phosphatidylinositol-3-phosphatase
MRRLLYVLSCGVALCGALLIQPTVSATTPHVLLILEENHSLQQIIGSSKAPYINKLAKQYGLATHLNDLSHPSEPNYLGLIAGSIFNDPQDTTPQQRSYAGPTLVDELAAANLSWKAYMEDMPKACDLRDTFGPKAYDVNHNPFMYFTSIRNNSAQCNRDVPFTQFASDLSAGTLPDFMWWTPNLHHDMHVPDGTVAQGDTWLSNELPAVLNSAWYAAGGIVILTWDEGVTTEQVATIVISAHTPTGARDGSSLNHYSTLRTLEKLYGVGLLRNSANNVGDLQPLL